MHSLCSYASIGPASNFYEVCEENNPSLYQDYGKRETILLRAPVLYKN